MGARSLSIPPPPPGFSLDSPRNPPRVRSAISDIPSPPEGFKLDGGAIDGDTLSTANGPHLRLYGVDAPETGQQGWDRQGQPVPIGANARAAVDGMVDPFGAIGNLRGYSYGRPVAPVTEGGQDVGQRMVRTGNALAEPSYMKREPDRAQSYMEGERLARQNRLGVHGVYAQTPADFRHNPDPAPSRETVARFWDTPTPMAGLRPEIEKGYQALLHSGTPDQILAYAKDNYFTLNPRDVAAFVKDRDAHKSVDYAVTYKHTPKPLTNQGDGAVGAAVRGVGDGVLPNLLDEAGAVVDTLGVTPDRENVFNSDRRVADIWANNQQQNEAITGYDALAHPYVRGAGEIVGGLALPMGKVETAADLAKGGAGYGFLGGFGQGDTLPERLTTGAIGLGEGVATTVLGTKALEYAAPRLKSAFGGRTARETGLVLPEGIPAPPEGFSVDPMPMAAEPGPAATSDLRRPDYLFAHKPTRMDAPLTEAQMRAASERIEPRDVLPVASNEVGSVEEAARIDAGRYEPAKPVDEASTLARRTVTAANGRPLPKRGPLDLVTWLRANGGVKDEGGDLTSMGIGNAPRDLDFARGEQRFGKLVDNTHGMSLDDAAFKAWEAGYLPQGDRPTINRFIEALGATHSGRERFFHPDDLHEVETFDATRADRMALEEQLADGPVYNDRSVPADEPQPFPPPQAYEDWPSGGPNFAGNIRLEKLDSPQDIKRALTTVQDRVGFDAATRGRVTQAETERLASELGMTPDALLLRRKGQALNAEEALAARQILAKSGNELVNMARKVQQLENPGDDAMAAFRRAWMRHAAIQEQVAGATAEAGRALQQFRMMADSRAINKDVLSAMIDHGGGPERIKQAAETLLDAVEAGPGVFNTVADKLAKPRFRDKITEVYINSLLSGPQTHVVNTVSNTLTALGQIPEHAVAAGFGGVRRMAGRGEDGVLGSEVGARAFGLLQGMKEGLGLFARSLRTGEPVDLVSKVETQQFKAVSGIKGEIVRLSTRFLMAEDEFFKGVARRMELNGLAVRQARKEGLRGAAAKARIADLSANPPDDMLAKSMDYARYLTFQRKLGPGAAHVAAITQDWPILKPFLPFVRTPTNLLKFATERSPAAPMLREWRADFKAGGARRDIAVARMLVGTGAGMAIYQYALAGRISGSPPTDPAKAKLLYADGWQPYSIKLGDKWYSYKRLDPFSTTLGVAADMALLPQGMSEHQLNEGAPLLVASIMGNLASKTWLSGLSDIIEALDDPERNADKLIQRLAGAVVVPSAVAQMARTVDPVARETDGVGEYIQSRVPGVSDNLLPRRDVWGQPITNEGGVGPDMLSPIWQSTQKSGPVNRALLDAGVSVGLPQRKIGDRQLTPQEYDSYQAKAGAIAYPRLRSLVGSKAWSAMDDEARQDSVGDVMKGARKAARTSLFGSAKAPASTASKAVPPPPGFIIDGAAGGLNLYRDLQSAIPGVRLTSGFRTPAYQADMKRRGYHPADDSRHLDGSSFDMLPPPGKSLGWLRGAVKRFHPDARLLNEGDHLHATFPGYYGAPAIGGAKAAGLRNPLAGMPPPPPGFKIDAR